MKQIIPVTEDSGYNLILNICGPAGAGKSHSALTIARGLVDNGNQVCVVDTEKKSFTMKDHPAYRDCSPFNVISYPPEEGFSLSKLIESLTILKNNNKTIKVGIIDSFSSVYADLGGMKDFVRNSNSRNSQFVWGTFSTDILRVKTIAQSIGMHLIFTTRANYEPINGVNKVKQNQKDDFLYLYHADIFLDNRKVVIQRDNTGCFRNNSEIVKETGLCLRKWCRPIRDEKETDDDFCEKVEIIREQIKNDPIKRKNFEAWIIKEENDAKTLEKLDLMIAKLRM